MQKEVDKLSDHVIICGYGYGRIDQMLPEENATSPIDRQIPLRRYDHEHAQGLRSQDR
jgi:hypothetical protein